MELHDLCTNFRRILLNGHFCSHPVMAYFHALFLDHWVCTHSFKCQWHMFHAQIFSLNLFSALQTQKLLFDILTLGCPKTPPTQCVQTKLLILLLRVDSWYTVCLNKRHYQFSSLLPLQGCVQTIAISLLSLLNVFLLIVDLLGWDWLATIT